MVDNFSLNYKMLLYKIVVGIVTVALCAALLYPTLRMLATSEPLKDLLDLIREFLRAVVSGNTEFLQTFPDGCRSRSPRLVAYIGESRQASSFLRFPGVIVLISRFLSGMGGFAFGVLIDDRMSSHANTAFFSCLYRQPRQGGALAGRLCAAHLRLRRALARAVLCVFPHPAQRHFRRLSRHGWSRCSFPSPSFSRRRQ